MFRSVFRNFKPIENYLGLLQNNLVNSTPTLYAKRTAHQKDTKKTENPGQPTMDGVTHDEDYQRRPKIRTKLAPTTTLNNGLEMPLLGMGTSGMYGQEAEHAVGAAIESGYRLVDTAIGYGNEVSIGNAISHQIKYDVDREDMFIISKLWNTFHDPKHVEYGFVESLTNLGLDYIDLFLMHTPIGYDYVNANTYRPKGIDGRILSNNVDYLDTWAAMEQLVRNGVVKSIGVSNFNSYQIKRLLKHCCIPPVVNQIECNPAINQKRLIEHCARHNIATMASRPLGNPNENYMPYFYHSKVILDLAENYIKTPAQIALRYCIQNNAIPIPRSSNHQRIKENINVFDFKLKAYEMANIDSLNTNSRTLKMEADKSHHYYPFHDKY